MKNTHGGAGRGQGRKPLDGKGATKVAVTLLPAQVETMKQLGNGNLSAGIRKAIEMTNARELAALVVGRIHIDAENDYYPVSGTIMVGHNAAGYWVTDNGEEVFGLTKEKAIDIIVENLTAE